MFQFKLTGPYTLNQFPALKHILCISLYIKPERKCAIASQRFVVTRISYTISLNNTVGSHNGLNQLVKHGKSTFFRLQKDKFQMMQSFFCECIFQSRISEITTSGVLFIANYALNTWYCMLLFQLHQSREEKPLILCIYIY